MTEFNFVNIQGGNLLNKSLKKNPNHTGSCIYINKKSTNIRSCVKLLNSCISYIHIYRFCIIIKDAVRYKVVN